MAAPKGNKNASGNSGGKTLQDRELAATVRNLALREIKEIIENKAKNKDLYRAVIIKLAGSVLPRLNEHSGENGDPIEHRVIYLPQRNERLETAQGEADRGSDNNTQPGV